MGAVEAARRAVVDPVLLDLAGKLDVPAGDAHKGRRRPRHSTPCRAVIVSLVAAGLHGQDAARGLPDHERIVDASVPLQPFRLAAAPLEALQGLIGEPLDLGQHPIRRLLQPPAIDSHLPFARTTTQNGREPVNSGSACCTTSRTMPMSLARASANPSRVRPPSTASRLSRSLVVVSPTERRIRSS